MPDLNPAEQAEVRTLAERQEKQFRRMLLANRNKVFAIQAIRTHHEQIDQLAVKIKAKPTVKFDCKPGCSYCCNLRIEATPPDVFILARRLRGLPPDELNDLLSRLRDHSAKATGLRMEDFFLTCTLLVNGHCSVYEDRPTMCRKYFSMDVEECKKPDAAAPEDGEMVIKSAAMIYGTTQAYIRARLPHSSHELGQALLIALTDATAEDRWYKGEEVFPPIPEATNEP
jgi:uncharacterized protein